jgi:DNA repair exonuclease SbcCD nuclease subunit
MRIAVISDLHLGFAWGTERQEDSFRNAREAFSKALAEKPDVILLLGDIFHDRVPKPEILAPTIELFAQVKNSLKPVKILSKVKDKKEEVTTGTIPAIIGIYGTHERRHAYSINPVQTLTKANLIKYLHAESILLNIDGERLGLHGLSGVPEAYAKDALSSWAPTPFPQARNLLLLHQDFKELIPNPDALSIADLPNDFDLFLLGHIHWRVEDKHPAFKTPILIPGSTVTTQLKDKEAKIKKGFYLIEIKTEMHIRFIELDTRPFEYIKIDVNKKRPSDILTEITNALDKKIAYQQGNLKPVYKFKLRGNLEGFLPTDLNFKSVTNKFKDKAIIFIDKSSISSAELSEKAKLLADLKSNKISIDQLGLDLLAKNLKVKDRNKLEEIFNLLAEGELEKVESLINDTRP